MKKLLLLLLLSLGLSVNSYAGSYVCTSTSYFDEGSFTNVYKEIHNGYLDAQSGEILNVKENDHFLAMSYSDITDDFAAGTVVAIINKDKMTFIKSMTNAIELSPPVYQATYRNGKCILLAEEELKPYYESGSLEEEKALELAELVERLILSVDKMDKLNTLKSAYVNNIAARVRAYWRYQGAGDDWSCEVYVQQDIDGTVQAVNIQKCNVDDSEKARAFKDSIGRAVKKASPLPSAPDDAVFDREILFYFEVN